MSAPTQRCTVCTDPGCSLTIRPRRSMTGNARRSGLTLIDIFAVVVIVITMVLMILPLIGISRVNANQQRCGKNQSQIMGACVGYAQSIDIPWPAPWGNTIGSVPKGQAIAAGVAAMNYTFGCFEVLANEASLPNGLFRCPSAESPGPDSRAQPGPASPEISGSNWADAGGRNCRRIGYAFDWASPGDPGATRVVFSDRDVTNHKRNGVMACFGDSHTKFLKFRSGTPSSAAPNETIGMDGTNVVVGEADNPDGAGSAGVAPSDQLPDNIFNSLGDVPAGKSEAATALTPGGGDQVRAFVK